MQLLLKYEQILSCLMGMEPLQSATKNSDAEIVQILQNYIDEKNSNIKFPANHVEADSHEQGQGNDSIQQQSEKNDPLSP